MRCALPSGATPPGFYPWSSPVTDTCAGSGDTRVRPLHAGIEVAGKRLYTTPQGTLQILDME